MSATKTVHDDVLDAALNYIKDNADRLVICEDDPADGADAILDKGSGGHKLVIKTISSSDFTEPTNGDSSGRKITVNEQTGITIDASGDGTVIALVKSVGSVLLYTTTCPTKSLTAGNKADMDAWDVEIEDPT